MLKLGSIIITELILLLVCRLIHWVYKEEDHLVWSNDYDIIESLHGEIRYQYIKESKHLDYWLMKCLMVIPLPIALPLPSIWLASIIIVLTIGISCYAIYRAFQLRKKYKAFIIS